jgi:hypothetical protein
MASVYLVVAVTFAILGYILKVRSGQDRSWRLALINCVDYSSRTPITSFEVTWPMALEIHQPRFAVSHYLGSPHLLCRRPA